MNELETIRIRKREEHQKGDVRKACEKSGVTPAVLQSALKKDRIENLTDKEILVIQAYLEILNERKKAKDQLKNIIGNLMP
jgi:hypothetical protein